VTDADQNISIPFKMVISLVAELYDSKVKIRHGDSIDCLQGTQKIDIDLDVCFNTNEKQIRILEFSGFMADPRPYIKIEKISINGYDAGNFKHLLSFDMKDNLYVENTRISVVDMISFNGSLIIDTEINRDRLTWFPMTYSKERSGIVYSNTIMNCQSPYGCFKDLGCAHYPEWKRFELQHHDYDLVALGCSFTAGTGILKEKTWPSLLAEGDEGSVLNLGFPGAGCDSILVNLKTILLKKIKFKKIVILLPTTNRKLLRVKKHGLNFNFCFSRDTQFDRDTPPFDLFFDKNEHQEIIKRAHRKLVLGHPNRRDQKIVNRIVSCLRSAGVDFFISSWCDVVYDILLSCINNQKNLLPKFNEDNDTATGRDGGHPAEHIHEKWVKSIKRQVGLGE
jgi:hypothetical protein